MQGQLDSSLQDCDLQLLPTLSIDLTLHSDSQDPLPLHCSLKPIQAEIEFEQFLLELQSLNARLQKREKPNLPRRLQRVMLFKRNCHCTICQEQLPARSKAVKLKCNHKYHSKCINKWLQKHSSCPLCRHEIE